MFMDQKTKLLRGQSILPKVICKFSTIPLKIPAGFLLLFQKWVS